jgi:hypothetical protein
VLAWRSSNARCLLRLAPEHLVIPIRVERRIDVDEIHAAVRQLPQLFEIVAAVNDPGIDD